MFNFHDNIIIILILIITEMSLKFPIPTYIDYLLILIIKPTNYNTIL